MQLGRYQLEERLGQGGMAEILRARETTGLMRAVAIKRVLPELSAVRGFREAFLAEVALHAQLSHPHIVRVLDAGNSGDAMFLVLELIDGVDLRTLLKRGALLPVAAVVRIVADVAEALDYAHGLGVLHRDVSPSNILVGRDGLVRLTDFGVAKALSAADHATKSHAQRGKYAYFAPEQVEERAIDSRTDIFALATVAYEALTGTHPFKRPTELATKIAITRSSPAPVHDLRGEVPAALAGVLTRALSREPADRFASAGEFVRAWLGAAAPLKPHHGQVATHVAQESRQVTVEAIAQWEKTQ